MKNHPSASRYRRHLEGQVLSISFMTVAELYEGAFRDSWGKEKLNRLEEILHVYVVIPSTSRICER